MALDEYRQALEQRAELLDAINARVLAGGDGISDNERAELQTMRDEIVQLRPVETGHEPSELESASGGAALRAWVDENMQPGTRSAHAIPREAWSSETRAIDATAASQVMSPVEVVGVSAFIRPNRALDFLGITSIGVAPGTKQLGFMTTSPDATMQAEDETLAQFEPVANAYTDVNIDPKQCVAPRGLTRFAEARWGSTMSAVIEDGIAAVSDQLEKQTIVGNGTGNNFSGLMEVANYSRQSHTSIDNFGTVATAIAGLIDGKYAQDFSDLRVLTSPDGFEYLASLYRGTNSTDRNVLEHLRSLGIQVRVSAHMPGSRMGTTNDDGANGAHRLVDFLIRRGNRPMAATLISWESLRVDMDSVPGKGDIAVVYSLSDLKVAGASEGRDDWHRISVRTN